MLVGAESLGDDMSPGDDSAQPYSVAVDPEHNQLRSRPANGPGETMTNRFYTALLNLDYGG